jgi:hypothetical protein
LFDHDPDVAGGTCHIIDVSADGAGVELFGDAPIEPVGHWLTISVRGAIDDTTISVRVRGVVRYVILGTSGGVRVGIKFADLSDEERETLETLEKIQASGIELRTDAANESCSVSFTLEKGLA